MSYLNYALPATDYTLKNALLWGNFSLHCQKACHGTWGKRVVHVIICVAEFLPVVSQIASLFEMIIAKYLLDRLRERFRNVPVITVPNLQQKQFDQKEVGEKDPSPPIQPGLSDSQTFPEEGGMPKGEPSPKLEGSEGQTPQPTDPPVNLPNITPDQLQKQDGSPNISPASSDLSETPSTDSETPVSVNLTAELQLEKGRQDKNKENCLIA